MTQDEIDAVYNILLQEFKDNPAPVIDLMAAQGAEPYKILIATILSARTKDSTTSDVVRNKLFPALNRLEDLDSMTVEQIEQLIFPVGFYRQKAASLKKLPAVLHEKFGGKLPQTVEELCELPGVGRKTANLVVALAFQKPAICVDVHVNRICNRLGIVSTSTPYETEEALRKILPQRLWRTWNACFVSFGQRTCTPRNPKCNLCRVSKFCQTFKSQYEMTQSRQKEKDKGMRPANPAS